MAELNTYSVTNRYDPTHTTVLRDAFTRVMKRRFNELAKVVIVAVNTEDCFRLNPDLLQANQMTTPGAEAFGFARSADKVQAFMKWIQQQIDNGILEIGTYEQIGTGVYSAWTNLYIFDSYKRGIMRARQELRKAGFKVPSVEESGGIGAIMAQPFHIDTVGLLYTRVFNELKGITSAMDSMISRILSQGLIDGDGPVLLAKKLVSAINGKLQIVDSLGRKISGMNRAILLARTEIIRAHHLATIQEYRNWGAEGVVVMAELSTAGDDRVCAICSAMEGKIFTLDEIESLIPLHPQCRCIALPWMKELVQYYAFHLMFQN